MTWLLKHLRQIAEKRTKYKKYDLTNLPIKLYTIGLFCKMNTVSYINFNDFSCFMSMF